MKTASFVRHEELVPGVWQAFFRPDSPLDYLPGQYVELILPAAPDDPRGPQRTFTLTTLPSEEVVGFIYRADEPMSPYKQVLQSLEVGTEVRLGEVLGDLVLPKLSTVPLIFIAGGIGMASFTAMLKQLSQHSEQRTVHLFYSLRSQYDDAFKAQVDSFPFASKNRYIQPNRLDVNDILQVANSDSLIYLSGSEPYVQSLRDQLHALGFSHSQIVFDYYDGYADL